MIFFSIPVSGFENKPNYSLEYPDIELTYVDSGKGAFSRIEWVTNSLWLWMPSYEYSLIATPVLRVTLRIPFNFEVTSLDVDVKIVVEEFVKSELVLEKRIIVDIPFYYQSTKLTLLRRGSKKISTVNIDMTPKSSNLFLSHESCASRGINFKWKSLEKKERITNVAVTCDQVGETLSLNFQHENGWEVFAATDSENLRVGKFRGIYTLNLEGVAWPKDGRLETLYMTNSSKQKVLEINVYSDGQIFSQMNFQIGGSTSFVNYSESGDVNNQVNALLLKIITRAEFVPHHSAFIFSSQIEFTPAVLFTNQKNSLRGEYSKFEASINKKLTKTNDLSWYSAGLGWIVWNMNTNTPGWGVDYLVGPELIMSRNVNRANDKQYRITLRYSPLIGESGFQTENHLFNFETLYELSDPNTLRSIYLYSSAFVSHFDSKAREMNVFGFDLGLLFDL